MISAAPMMIPALVAIALPGCALARVVLPDRSRLERWSVGTATSVALAVCVCWYAAALGHVSLAWVAWAVVAAASIAARVFRTSGLVADIRPRPDARAPWLILAGSAAIWASIILSHRLPIGWDPSFHSMLAKKIAMTGRLAVDWSPWDPVTVNYPLGPHALMAAVSRLTAVPVHEVFGWLMLLCGVTLAGLTYTLARAVGLGHRTAAVAMIIGGGGCGGWAWRGSIEYATWGGLPNLMGMCALMASGVILLRGRPRLAGVASAVIVGCIPAIHHHVSLAAAIAAVAVTVPLAYRGRLRWRSLATFLAVALAVGAGPVIWLASRVGGLGNTSVAGEAEPLLGLWGQATVLGPAFFVAAAWGLWRSRRGSPAARAILWRVAVALLATFVACDYGFRTWRWAMNQTPATLLTPSRFLTDAVPILGIIAAAAVCVAVRRLARTPMARRWVMGIVMAAGLAPNVDRWVSAFNRPDPVNPSTWLAYEWIAANTAPDAVVCTRSPWAAYLSGRRTLRSPLPISEPLALVPGLVERAQGHALFEVKDVTALSTGDSVKYALPGTQRVVVEATAIPRHFFVIDDWK